MSTSSRPRQALLRARLVVFRVAGVFFVLLGGLGTLIFLAGAATALLRPAQSAFSPWWLSIAAAAMCYLFVLTGLKCWRLKGLNELEEQAADLDRRLGRLFREK